MRKRYISLIIISALLILGILGVFFANRYIKKVVAEKLEQEFEVKFVNLDASIWNRRITVDSVQGFLNQGSLAHAKLTELNWFSLYMNPEIDLDNVCFSASDFSTRTEDGTYLVTIDSMNKQKDEFEIFNLQMGSGLSDEEFHDALKYRQPKIDLKITGISASGFTADSNYIQELLIENMVLDVDENLNLPIQGNKKKLPAEILAGIKTPFIVNQISSKNGTINYAVIDNGRSEKAKIDFENVSLSVENLRSDSSASEMIMDLSCNISGAPLKVVTRNFLNHPNYKYDFYGHLQDYNFTALSQVTEAAKGISITSGYVNNLEMEGSFNDDRAEGTVKIDYKDLKIDLEKDIGNILSFVSNAGIKSTENTTVEFSSSREREKGYLVHVIQSLVEAMKKALLII